jgi:peptidoglycan/xylan/chitin deacetylase (PgdA/CDA1 family)
MRRTTAGAVLVGALGSVALPAVAAIQPVRRLLTPGLLPDRLSGVAQPAPCRIALTFDDGPDRLSTPFFLDVLAEHATTATFFVLGRHALEEPALLRRMVDDGHEIAVHGWTHRCVAAIGPRALAHDLRATKDIVEQTTGTEVRWYRPPYGVMTTPALVAARHAGLTTVLWSAWGVDWRRGRTVDQVIRTVERDLLPGGTILLHDTDRTSAPGSWRTTLGATRVLLEHLAEDGVRVAPLREHLAPAPV